MQTTLVTGGTGGVGVAVLERLVAEGHEVTATFQSERGRDHAHAAVGEKVRFVPCDVSDEQQVAAVVSGLESLTNVVNLVGGFRSGPKVHETDPADFAAMLQLNLTPSFLLARAAVPKVLASGGGSFVAVSARATQRPFAGAAGYLTSKAALIALVQALDVEYRSQGLRANALLPGTIDTPANRESMPKADRSSWVTPEAFADAVAALLSPQSSAIAGATLPLTGMSAPGWVGSKP